MNTSTNNILKSLTKAECYYLDHRLVSKSYINRLPSLIKLENEIRKNTLVLNTCLRYEVYNFFGDRFNFKDKEKFAYTSGSLCLRRFISLLCGLQSEIIGEREIFLQARKAVYNAVQNRSLSKECFWKINSLFDIAEQIRNKHSLTQLENYSTIGADLLNRKIKSPAVIAIIGGGYMAEIFFKKVNMSKIKKIIWINRSLDKVKKIVNDQNNILKDFFEFYNFENVEEKLRSADFIFSAAHNCGGLFSSLRLEKTKCVIDISYPALFSDKVSCEFYSINNTYFENLLKNPVPKMSVLAAEKEIDALFKFL
ncbi:MAG: hypothetical protein AAB600_03140 [Patescibacteria group bacterium]